MDEQLAFAGSARLAELLRAREVGSRELTEGFLERIERLDPALNAFRSVWPERALEQAAAADRRIEAGETAPMLGVPIALKDEFADIEGDVSAIGTDAFSTPARADGQIVRLLRDAGAVVVGKTNLPELAIYGFTESQRWGVTGNPWNPRRTPGGSSGGSAAAVAAGLVAVASGSDGAGSIRIPAAQCGLFGLKPQRGRVPLGGAGGEGVEHWRGLTVHGCVSRTVRDTALWLDATATGGTPPEGGYRAATEREPGALRIAVSSRAPRLIASPIVDDEVVVALDASAELLRGLGHGVEPRDPDYGLVGNRITARYVGGIRDDIEAAEHPQRLEKRTRGFARLARLLGGERAVARAVRGEAADARRILAIFDHCDVLLTPTVSTPPVPVGQWEGKGTVRTLIGMSRRMPYTVVWNHLGNPAAAVPAGFTRDGLPLSVQIVAPPNREDLLLSLAAQIEAERPWAGRRPPAFTNPGSSVGPEPPRPGRRAAAAR